MKRFLVVMTTVAALASLLVAPVFGADKLLVKDSGGSSTLFAVEDGTSSPNRILRVLNGVPIMQNAGNAGFDIKNTNATFAASMTVGTSGNPNLYANWLGVANTKDDMSKVSWGVRLGVTDDKFHVLRLPAGQATGFADVFVINANGSITSSTGATLTSGGHWQDASSRAYKENIIALSSTEAHNALAGLNPVKYNYKVDKDERHVGFIAEDVPDIVAAKDRKSLSPMDIVAVLTKVVQEQQEAIDAKGRTIERQQKTLEEQQKTLSSVSEKLEKLERLLQLKGNYAYKVD